MNKKSFKPIVVSITAGALWAVSAWASQPELYGVPISNVTQEQHLDLQTGYALEMKSEKVKANEVFKQFTQNYPNVPSGWIGLARSSTSWEQFSDSVNQAEKLLDKANEAEKIMIKLQRTYIQGDEENRLKLSQQFVEKYPKSVSAWLARGWALESVKQNSEARDAFAKAAKVDPTNVAPHFAAGSSYLFSEPKNFQQAEKHFFKATKIQPTAQEAYIGLGDALRAQSNFAAAKNNYTRAIWLDASDGTGYTKRGHVNTFLGKYSEARGDYDKATSVSSTVDAAFLGSYKTFTHIYQGQPEKSVEELQQWMATIDTMPLEEHQKTQAKLFTIENMIMVNLHHNQFGNAERNIASRAALVETQLKSINDKLYNRIARSENRFWDGYLQARKGDIKVAKATADKMIQLLQPVKSENKLEQYHELMGFISLKQEQWDNAIAHYNMSNLNKVYVQYHKAVALDRKGEKQKAQRLFVDVANNNFNSVDYALVRADAMERSKLVTASLGGN